MTKIGLLNFLMFAVIFVGRLYGGDNALQQQIDELLSINDPVGWNIEDVNPKDTRTICMLEVDTLPAEVRIVTAETLRGEDWSLPETREAIVRNLQLRRLNGSKTELQIGRSVVVVVITDPHSIRATNAIWAHSIRFLSEQETIEVVKRWKDHNLVSKNGDSEALSAYLRRAQWREMIQDPKRTSQAASEVVDYFRTKRALQYEAGYLIPLLLIPIWSDNEEVRKLVAGSFDVAEKETTVAGRTAWLRVFVAWIYGGRAGDDPNKTMDALSKYLEWWDCEALKRASIPERADYCTICKQAFHQVTFTLPQQKKLLEQRSSQQK